jgi:hypothetical protein
MMEQLGKLATVDLVYLKAAMAEVEKANVMVAFVQSVLVQRYGLREGDKVSGDDGTITRTEP